MNVLRVFRQMMVASVTCLLCSTAMSADGLVSVTTAFAVNDSLDRLEAQIRQRGLLVFARIDHAGGAAQAGMQLRPTAVLLFGHPKGGTPFMQCAQSVGIDLPLKVLAWTDADGQSWLGYNDPAYIARRHGVADCPAVENLRALLAALVTQSR